MQADLQESRQCASADLAQSTRSSVNLNCSQDLSQYINEWNGSADPEGVTRVILHVGNIANGYDELTTMIVSMELHGH